LEVTKITQQTILVVVDPGSDSHPVVECAAWLAEKTSAGLDLFICDYDPSIEDGRLATVWIDEPVREHLLSILRDKLEALAAPLRDRGLAVSTDVVWDHPLVEGIVRKVRASNPWMIAKDTHHHGLLKRTILSNTDWGLIRDCPVPVYLVQPNPNADKPRVYAAVDPTHAYDKPAELDHRIVGMAKVIADASGGELHVVHTYAVPIPIAIPEAVPVDNLIEAVEEEHRLALADFLKPYAIPAEDFHLLPGQPPVRLPEISESGDSDLIVMGAISRSGLDRVFLGSTAERTLDRLACDLLIVKLDGPNDSAV
jgi:universal stress protein E